MTTETTTERGKIYRVGFNGNDELVEAADGRDALINYADAYHFDSTGNALDWVHHDVYENEMGREEHQIKVRGRSRSWTLYAVEEHVIRLQTERA